MTDEQCLLIEVALKIALLGQAHVNLTAREQTALRFFPAYQGSKEDRHRAVGILRDAIAHGGQFANAVPASTDT